MKNNKKGAALMQVLLIALVLAGIATMMLRVTLSRTSSARQTRRISFATMLIESCMAEVNELWSSKTPIAFRRDMAGYTTGGNGHVKNQPYMYCAALQQNGKDCVSGQEQDVYTCTYSPDGVHDYVVTAQFKNVGTSGSPQWRIQYEIAGDASAQL